MKIARIDKLGRIVIPMTYRKQLGIKEYDEISIDQVGSTIIISPLKGVCRLCGSRVDASTKMQLCESCIKQVKAL
ncbi:MAG: AbrB/MazE/SpoVT family DNA-binding domain-containing protein [Clostridia bacterium]|nr:AbrB/MazE/SpoVT family DNA-binding domain-containing protein [Clostridia bacterium]